MNFKPTVRHLPLLLLVVIIPGLLLVLFLAAGGWLTPQRLSAQSLVQSLQQNSGVHPGYRRNHAKGVCVTGDFTSSGNAAFLSRASVFQPGTVPVIGRFAIAGGNPHAPDYGVPVRSLALEFQLAHGEQWRTGMNALPFFPVSTPQAFYDQQQASRPLPQTGKPDAQKLMAFTVAHPEVKPFFAWVKTHVLAASWAQEQYNSLNAFRFTNAQGETRFVRWSLVPLTPWQPISAAQQQQPDYLQSDLHDRLATAPLKWDLVISVAQPGDAVNDASKVWPADRQQVVAGTLTLRDSSPQQGGSCNDINYDPLILPQGISGSDDPLLNARSAAYAKSFNLRTAEQAHQQEKKS